MHERVVPMRLRCDSAMYGTVIIVIPRMITACVLLLPTFWTCAVVHTCQKAFKWKLPTVISRLTKMSRQWNMLPTVPTRLWLLHKIGKYARLRWEQLWTVLQTHSFATSSCRQLKRTRTVQETHRKHISHPRIHCSFGSRVHMYQEHWKKKLSTIFGILDLARTKYIFVEVVCPLRVFSGDSCECFRILGVLCCQAAALSHTWHEVKRFLFQI